MNTNTPLTSKQARWLKHLQAADHSGQSLSAYAQSHALNVKQIYYWSKVLRPRGELCHDKPSHGLFQKARITPPSTC